MVNLRLRKMIDAHIQPTVRKSTLFESFLKTSKSFSSAACLMERISPSWRAGPISKDVFFSVFDILVASEKNEFMSVCKTKKPVSGSPSARHGLRILLFYT